MPLADVPSAAEFDGAHATRSLNRGAVALLANGAGTALFGAVYWIIAAHLYATSVIGRSSALVAAMLTISGLGQCNFMRSLSALLPRAGHKAVRLLARVYLAIGGISLILGITFALLAPFISPNMRFVRTSEFFVPGFALAVVVWSVFSLEDTVLVSTRSAKIVPFENAIYGVLKISLLLVLHRLHFGIFAIFVSWVLPLLFVIIPINWYLFRKALPSSAAFAAPSSSPSPMRAPWVRYDFAGYLFWLVGTLPLPILVLARLGSVKAAIFYIPFTVVGSVDLISLNVGNAFTAELERKHGQLDRSSFTFLARLWVLVATAALALVVAAPLVLQLFGSHYRTQGHLVLVILTLAVLPRSIMFFAIAAARAQAHGGRILLLQTIAAVGTLALAVLLLNFFSLDGIALAWFSASLASGTIALFWWARAFRQVAHEAT